MTDEEIESIKDAEVQKIVSEVHKRSWDSGFNSAIDFVTIILRSNGHDELVERVEQLRRR